MVVNYAIRYIDQRHLVEAKRTNSFQNLEIPKIQRIGCEITDSSMALWMKEVCQSL